MSVGWPELHEAGAAARSGDLDRLRQLIDWPLSGLPTMLITVAAVDSGYRAVIVASGLSELDRASDDPQVTRSILPPIAARLAQSTALREADAGQRESFLAALRSGNHAPEGLTPDQLDRLATLSARAEAVSDVCVLSSPLGDTVVGRVPITGRLAFVLSSLSAA